MINWGDKFWQLEIKTVRALVEQAVIRHLVTARHAAPLMLRQGSGLIVEVSDGHHYGYRGQLLYDLVKSTVNRLGYAMAWDLHEARAAQGGKARRLAVKLGFADLGSGLGPNQAGVTIT